MTDASNEMAREVARRIVREFRSEGWPAKEEEIARLIERNLTRSASKPDGWMPIEAERLIPLFDVPPGNWSKEEARRVQQLIATVADQPAPPGTEPTPSAMAMAARLEEAAEWLDWVGHRPGCDAWQQRGSGGPGPCTCGLDDVRETLASLRSEIGGRE